MALDPNGPNGLWRRLNVWVYHGHTVAELAAILQVDPASLAAYLDDPANALSPSELASIDVHLAEVPRVDWKVTDGKQFKVFRSQKPRWTQEDVDAIPVPAGSAAAVTTGYEASYEDDLESEGPNDLDTFDIAQQVDAAWGDNLDDLDSITFYVPND